MFSAQKAEKKLLQNKVQIAGDLASNKHNLTNIDSNHLQILQCKVEQHTLTEKKFSDDTIVEHEITKKQKRRRFSKKGHWDLEQNAKYYIFLSQHLIHFRSAHFRKLERIFKQMAVFIGSRTSNQCRSHHQKQEKKHIELDILMSNLYQLTKQHPLLAQEPPFSKFDVKYKDIFASTQVQSGQTQSPKQNGQIRTLIVYEMPQLLEAISYQRYLALFSSK